MSSPETERAARRRSLVKAAAGVGAVFTLPSGAALAATSLTCNNKSATLYNEGPKPVTYGTSPDNWMRIKLQKYKRIKVRLNGSVTEVEGFTYNGNWFRVVSDSGNNRAIQVVLDSGVPQKVTGQFYYGLVDYDGTPGKLILDQNQTNLNPIAGASCWNSLTGSKLTSNIL